MILWIVLTLMIALAAEVTIGVIYRTLGVSLSWYDEIASVLGYRSWAHYAIEIKMAKTPEAATAFLVDDFQSAPHIDDYAQAVGWRRIRI